MISHIDLAKRIGKAWAIDLYSTFLSGKNQGINFTWRWFREWAPNHAAVMVFMNYGRWDKFSERKKLELQEAARVATANTLKDIMDPTLV